MGQKRWDDLTDIQKTGIVLLASFQFLLLAASLWDLRRRTEAEINGSKRLWTLLVFVNFIGPIAYFRFGRKRY